MNSSLTSEISRRAFVKKGVLTATAVSLGTRWAHVAQAAAGKIPIGVQLYSVREQCAKDLPAVLKAVGEMGYKGVEFAGYYNRSAKDLRKMLDDNGLVCCGTHTALNTVQDDNIKATIEFNQILGNKYLIVPSMTANSRAGWLEKAKQFNELADKLLADRMLTGYHAHAGDFKKFEGETAWDLFFGNTKKSVVMQLDTGNCMDGEADPVALLKKYSGRAVTIHLKEHGGNARTVIGEGEVKWKDVFDLCEASSTEWYIVEHERGGPDSVSDVKRCLEALKKMGKT
jgi:sugar phosphate isomerase/epimerase